MIIQPININHHEIIRIADNYGKRLQTIKAVEELAELQQALCKLNIAYELNKGYAKITEIRENVTEEIADVIIMLNQISYLYGIQFNDLEKMIDTKVVRQFKRIEEGQ